MSLNFALSQRLGRLATVRPNVTALVPLVQFVLPALATTLFLILLEEIGVNIESRLILAARVQLYNVGSQLLPASKRTTRIILATQGRNARFTPT